MRIPISLAIFVSIILIGGATWTRFSRPTYYQASLEIVPKYESREPNEGLGDLTPKSTIIQKKLTDTDLVSRQLVVDYMGLINTGQATNKNLSALAGFYSENIPNLVTTPTISLQELRIVSNSRENLISYGESAATIYFKYEELLREKFPELNNEISNFTPLLQKTATGLSNLYEKRAEEMRNLNVPLTFANTHLELVNNYLAEATYYRLMTQIEEDPARAFAAIASQVQMEEKNELAYSRMIDILNSYGI